ncbi:hypothetical protein FB45DRAFT_1009762 [Roridomyces roridus]|uniref:Uncharacterized protein n=1 Tax=Roridomyces roridus TaxID=1738132 RepID=A0AAD7F9J9_9AGAR|nr:hypothetical protein FB45DRAFT_1009762 [Roridomyces roridus]
MPTLCFTLEHADIVETARLRVTLPNCSEDDLTELRYCDFATVVAFFRELLHVVWMASNPIEATYTPEKYKELKGRGEGVEGVHQWLWKTVVEFDCILDLSDSNEGSLFYNSWYRTPGDNETLRAVCYRNTHLLTRQGVHHVCRLLEPDAEAPIDNPPFVFHALEEARVKPPSPTPATSGKSPSPSALNASNYHLVGKPPLSTDVFRRPRTVKCGGVRRVRGMGRVREMVDKLLADDERRTRNKT